MSEYLTFGDTGAEPGIEWNSTKYAGVCKPSDYATLAKFKELQRQLNRVAQLKGYTKIAVDGDLGTDTVALAAQVLGGTYTCSLLAGTISSFTASVKTIADAAGVPATVSGPAPVKPPSIITPAGVEKLAPPGADTSMGASIYDAWDKLGTPGKLAAVGILGGIGYFAFVKKRKGRR